MCPACIGQAAVAVASSTGGLTALVLGMVVSKNRKSGRGGNPPRGTNEERKERS